MQFSRVNLGWWETPWCFTMVNHMDQWLHVGRSCPEGDGWGGGAVKRAVLLCFVFCPGRRCCAHRPVAQVIGDGRTLPAQDSALSGVTFGASRQTWQWELQWFV